MECEEFAVDVCRLNNFLINNQLVQANAIAQKLESILQADVMTSNSVDPEKNESFLLFRRIHMTRTYILAGNKDDAVKVVREIATTLPKKSKESSE
jgi:hypothetical protein